ncbi:hypothetical protein LCGC14_1950020 [marine sediment metagenome]|uniref:Uncharacterized protein n=1 Tax=marine sediment metagenome TaxID=412755 RepID=A0A0F9FI24_9ZZZZ
MRQQYVTTDSILSKLKFKKREKIKIVIDNDSVRLCIGPRNWSWDRRTRKWTGQGTDLFKAKFL